MIAKNEEACIAECLNSIKDLAKEMVVVDTGSTDRTVEIARQCGARIYHFPWNGSFADARNESLRHATGDWILSLDADEAIALQDHNKIQELVQRDDIEGYMLLQRNYTNDATRLRWEPCDASYQESKSFNGFVPCPICRLFRNKPEYQYKYKIHEMVNEAIILHGGVIGLTGIPIHHYKAFKTKEETMQKAGRYLHLLEQQIRDSPHDPKTYYEYGQLLLNLKRPKDALAALLKVAELEKFAGNAYSKIGFLGYLLAKAYSQLGRADEAKSWLEKGIAAQPNNKDCYLLLATILASEKKIKDAFAVLQRALNNNVEDNAIYNTLGVLFMNTGKIEEAIACFYHGRKINIGINPVIEKINNNLFSCHLLQKRYGEAAAVLEEAIRKTPAIASYHANLAQLYGNLGNYDKAREKLVKIKELHPEKAAYISQKLQELDAMEQQQGHPSPPPPSSPSTS